MAEPWEKMLRGVLAVAAIFSMHGGAAHADARAKSDPAWVPAYLSSPAAPIFNVPPEVIAPPQEIQGAVRYRHTLWAEGDRMALRLSNETGTKPLSIGHVTVALRSGTARKFVNVTFGGAQSLVIPAGAPALSDPVVLPVEAGSDILVSLYLPERSHIHRLTVCVRPNIAVAGTKRLRRL